MNIPENLEEAIFEIKELRRLNNHLFDLLTCTQRDLVDLHAYTKRIGDRIGPEMERINIVNASIKGKLAEFERAALEYIEKEGG